MVSNHYLKLIPSALLLFSPSYAWLATEYVGNATDVAAGITFTNSGNVAPTGSVSILSSSTTTEIGGSITVVQLIIAGINPLASLPSSPGGITSGLETSVVYYAPATVTQPPDCTKTQFSYVTPMSVAVPPIMFQSPNSLITSSSTAYMSTSFYVNVDGQTTSTSSWSQSDIYLAPGQCLPELDEETTEVLAACEDPRGCYTGTADIAGTGLGCTALGGGHGVTNGGTGAGQSTAPATAAAGGTTKGGSTASASTSSSTPKSAAASGRLSGVSASRWWIGVIMASVVLCAMIIL